MRSALNFPLVSYFHIYSLSKANNRQQQQTAHHSRSSVVGNYYFIYLTIKETTDSISPSSVVRTVMLVVPVFNIVCIGFFFCVYEYISSWIGWAIYSNILQRDLCKQKTCVVWLVEWSTLKAALFLRKSFMLRIVPYSLLFYCLVCLVGFFRSNCSSWRCPFFHRITSVSFLNAISMWDFLLFYLCSLSLSLALSLSLSFWWSFFGLYFKAKFWIYIS